MQKLLFLACSAMVLTACSDNKRDYDASARCIQQGYEAGTPAYASCIKEERTVRLMEQNRQEFEQRQQDEQYDRARRGIDRPF